MVQNTWNLHQSSICVSTFRKYEHKYTPVKNLAAATHFPLKIPRNSLFRGKIPFSRENPFLSIITEKFSALCKIVIEVKNFGMHDPYKCLQKASLIISTVTVTIRYRRYRENSRTVTKIQKNRYRQIGGR